MFWASFIFLVLGGNVALEQSLDSIKIPVDEIFYCHLPVKKIIRDGNASFNIMYRLRVVEGHEVAAVARVHGSFIELGDVQDCVKEWRIRSVPPGTELFFHAYWKHAEEWTHMTVRFPAYALLLKNYGNRCQYLSRS